MGILLTLMDYIMHKMCGLDSIQPQLRPKSKFGQKVELCGTDHELPGISNSFKAGWQPLVRPSKCPTNQCLISFIKKVFKGHSKRPKMKVPFYHFINTFFFTIFAFFESSGLVFLLRFHFQSCLLTFIFGLYVMLGTVDF